MGRRHPITALFGATCAWAGHLHRYLISGGVTVIADLSVFWILTSVLEVWYLYAHFISRTFGGVICFALNRYFTFVHRPPRRFVSEAARFLALYGMSFVLSSVLVYVFVSHFRAGAVRGKFVAECVVFLFNYTVMKYWVMAHRRNDG
ncbi:MAG: GtrA family protein [Pseudomonadota bacterium]